jgi:LPS O-antigen subunit length determinant protein (WzzB/FepE family)
MKKKIPLDVIDLSVVFFNLWKNKFQILLITTAFIIFGFLYFNSLDKNFIATTNIKPISSFENQRYKTFNTLAGEDSINIDKKYLLNLFINKIQTVEIIEKGIIHSKLISRDNFINNKDYSEELKRKAILIIDQMNSPKTDVKDKTKKISHWQYNFTVSDKLIWRNFLEYIENQANEEIRRSLLIQFNTNLDILRKDYKFKLEDIDQNIANEFDDYKNLINNKLAFLKEQAEIARTLNIAKNTLQSENFQADNAIVTNIKSEDSYYLKGYEMIEKEISLINSRKNEKFFIPNLIELEKSKRTILQNKKIERLKKLFFETPVVDKINFKAAKIDYLTTDYKSQQSLLKIIGISLVMGLLISFIYVFFFKFTASRK